MASHSSTLTWKITWTEKPGRLQSMGSLRVRHDWATSLSLFTFMHWRRQWQPTPCSCLENSRDGEAWWAAVSRVAQSQTWLKWLSSSSSRWLSGKIIHLPMQETQETRRFDLWVRKISWRRKWQLTPVFLPGKSSRQRTLVGYSPRGRKESDLTYYQINDRCGIVMEKNVSRKNKLKPRVKVIPIWDKPSKILYSCHE